MNWLHKLSGSLGGSSLVQLIILGLTGYGMYKAGVDPKIIAGTMAAQLANAMAPSPVLAISGSTKALKQTGG